MSGIIYLDPSDKISLLLQVERNEKELKALRALEEAAREVRSHIFKFGEESVSIYLIESVKVFDAALAELDKLREGK
jgi:hypothetical protein